MKEFSVTLTVKNNLLRERRAKLGLTQAELAKAAGIHLQCYGGLESMRESPMSIEHRCRVYSCDRTASGRFRFLCADHRTEEHSSLPPKVKWSKPARSLAGFYDCNEEDLFPDTIRSVQKTKVEFEMDSIDVTSLLTIAKGDWHLLAPASAELPEDVLNNRDVSEDIRRAIAKLSPREEMIIRHRFGIGEPDEKTLEDIGDDLGIQKETVRKIETQALLKLRGRLRKEHGKSA